MARINRIFIIKLHTILATAIFPIALMFFITGAFYSLDIEGDFDEQEIKIIIPANFQPNLQSTQALVTNQLQSKGISLPTSDARFQQKKNNVRLSWGGANISISLEYVVGDASASLKVYDADWYQRFARLHTADGGSSFKIYAVIMAISLFILLITGFIMAWQVPNYRKLAARSSILGALFFVLMVMIS